jgi:hypothetical protein
MGDCALGLRQGEVSGSDGLMLILNRAGFPIRSTKSYGDRPNPTYMRSTTVRRPASTAPNHHDMFAK